MTGPTLQVGPACTLTCVASVTAAGEPVDPVHAHALVQTGRGDALVDLRLAQRACRQRARTHTHTHTHTTLAGGEG